MNRKTGSNNGLSEYKSVGMRSEIESASPHRLIQMLLDGALAKISIAKGCIERGDIGGKCENIDWAISIVGGLQGSLDFEQGGSLALKLDGLYDYAARQLVVANAKSDVSLLNEVGAILGEVRAGWVGIAPVTETAVASAG